MFCLADAQQCVCSVTISFAAEVAGLQYAARVCHRHAIEVESSALLQSPCLACM
jgi:hypothetical protein